MNITDPRTRLLRAAVLVSTAIVTGSAIASAAAGVEPRPSGPSLWTVGPYAQPLDALGGRSLAHYLADIHASDPRLHLL